MLRRLALSVICAVFLSVAWTTSAQQFEFGRQCAEGPVVFLPRDVAWGAESHCSCAGLRGGALAGNNSFAWLWSEGRGQVAILLELQFRNGGVGWAFAFRADGSQYVSVNGSGLTEEMKIRPPAPAIWTGNYKAMCFLPPEVPSGHSPVTARCECAGGAKSTKRVCFAPATFDFDMRAACDDFCRVAGQNGTCAWQGWCWGEGNAQVLSREAGFCTPSYENTRFGPTPDNGPI